MSLLSARELSVAFGDRVLFDGATFALGPKDRVGLVGPNGSGKSTLMRILAGERPPDDGAVQCARGTRVGYLPQELLGLPEGPLVEAVMSSVPGRTALQARLEQCQAALDGPSEPDEQLELAQTLADLHQELDHFEERYGRHRAERILRGLGFAPASLERPTAALSGGWRMRAALAGLLLQDPDLLLLDEPTNHLDLPTLAWFDAFLKSSRKGLVLISHDRDFLDRQVGRILSLEVEGLRSYAGNYGAYLRLRAEELGQLRAAAAKQEARRGEIERFVGRFRAQATKARQVQSRVKMLEKMEEVMVLEERDKVRFRFPEVPSSGREAARLCGLKKSYGEVQVYDGVDLTVQRGQRIAIVGVNGAGKTTLLKLLAKELAADAGEVVYGHNVILGYYAQHHADTLDKRSTILEEVGALVPDRPRSFVRGVLGAFLFSGDDVDKTIGVLSGGERARVALAKLLLRPANLLLMDEPTNHLDLDSSEALIEALGAYGGTLVFVSHNRSFLNKLATHVWEVKDLRVTPYPGNLDDYLYHLSLAAGAEDGGAGRPSPERGGEDGAFTSRDRKRQEAEERQRRSRLEGPLKKEISQLEARISLLEAAQKAREAELLDPALYDDFARARPVLEAVAKDKAELESLYERWEQAQASLEAAGGRAAGG